MNDNVLDISFLQMGKHLWYKKVVDAMFAQFNSFKENGSAESQEPAFKNMVLEFYQANDRFIDNIKTLPLIMKCRSKNDSNLHFGGLECSLFMQEIINICNKYLRNTKFLGNQVLKRKPLINASNIGEPFEIDSQISIAQSIQYICDKAILDNRYAKSVEAEAKKKYMLSGQDNTLQIFSGAGYSFL